VIVDEFAEFTEQAWIWACNPIEWVKAVMDRSKFKVKTTETGLTTQQEAGLRELGKLIRAKLKVARGEKLTDQEGVYSKKIGISIQSGQGTGKDFFTALMGLFFLSCFPNPKVVATAPTAKQLRNVLWSEISKLMSCARKVNPEDPLSPTVLEELFTWQAERVFLTAKKGERWFWEGVTCNARGSEQEQAEVLGGRHEDHMLLIADEATGIPDAVFRPLEGTLTGPLNLLILIFNPTRTHGFAIDSQRDPRFVHLRWNAEESENVSREHIETYREKYGVESNPYRIRVLGLPPLAGADCLISPNWIADAIERMQYMAVEEDAPTLCGLDVGGGGDKSVLITRDGGKVRPEILRNWTKDTMEVVGWAVTHADKVRASGLMIDLVGLGCGVYDRVRQLRRGRTFGVDSRRTARKEEQFHNSRAENFWNMREAFEQGTIAIPDDKDLVDQLYVLKYKADERGRTQIYKKEDLRKELEGDSPDEADALANTYAYPESMFRGTKQKDRDKYGDKPDEGEAGWMGA